MPKRIAATATGRKLKPILIFHAEIEQNRARNTVIATRSAVVVMVWASNFFMKVPPCADCHSRREKALADSSECRYNYRATKWLLCLATTSHPQAPNALPLFCLTFCLKEASDLSGFVNVDLICSGNFWQARHCHDVAGLRYQKSSAGVDFQIFHRDAETIRCAEKCCIV